jgi:protein TonB
LAPRKHKSIQKKALGIALLGFATLVLFLNLMNGSVQFSKKKVPNHVKFEAKKLKKRSQQKIKKKKVVKRKSNKVKSLKPKMNLAFASSGLDLGIDILGLASGDSKLLSQQGDTVMTEDVVDRLPEVQYREPIPYPESAKEQNVQGHVTVNILVNKSGDVEQVKLLDSQPEGVFDQVTLASVKTWSFSPAEYKGQFVSVWVKQKLKFQVN